MSDIQQEVTNVESLQTCEIERENIEHHLKDRMRQLEDTLEQRTNGINEGRIHNQSHEPGSESIEAMRKILGEYGIRIKDLEEAMKKAKEPSENSNTTASHHEVSKFEVKYYWR